MPLGPAPKKPWQCPILPFLKPNTPFAQEDMAPTSEKLRAAVASIMRNAHTADILKVNLKYNTKLYITLRTN
jgi:hypothetical protein